MNTGIINLFRIKEIRNKILLTLGLLVVYRVGFHIPIPGVDYAKIADLARDYEQGGLGMIFGLMSTLSGGALGSCYIFSLGVMPYISASIIFSLLVKVVPALEKLSKEGASGQKMINKYTRWTTVLLCVIQSLFIIQGYLRGAVDSMQIFPPETFYTLWFHLVIVVTFTTGTIFIMWIGEQITEHGIGNGISLIIMAGILARLPGQFQMLYRDLESGERMSTFATLVGLYIAIVIGIVYVTRGQRRIPVQQAKLTRGRKVYGGQRHYLPLRVNQAGVMPIIFAAALFIVPPLLGKVLGAENFFDRVFAWGSFWYIVIYVALIFFFAFFWTALMFQPNDIANNLKESGGFVPGLRPGKRTADYLENVMYRVTLAGATFLALIAILPHFISGQLKNIPIGIAINLGGTSILIVVGVILDLVDKLNSQLLMRNYDGFTSGGVSSAWAKGRKR